MSDTRLDHFGMCFFIKFNYYKFILISQSLCISFFHYLNTVLLFYAVISIKNHLLCYFQVMWWRYDVITTSRDLRNVWHIVATYPGVSHAQQWVSCAIIATLSQIILFVSILIILPGKWALWRHNQSHDKLETSDQTFFGWGKAECQY